jgi:hypothetical protein
MIIIPHYLTSIGYSLIWFCIVNRLPLRFAADIQLLLYAMRSLAFDCCCLCCLLWTSFCTAGLRATAYWQAYHHCSTLATFIDCYRLYFVRYNHFFENRDRAPSGHGYRFTQKTLFCPFGRQTEDFSKRACGGAILL